jgi:hypothetical protein
VGSRPPTFLGGGAVAVRALMMMWRPGALMWWPVIGRGCLMCLLAIYKISYYYKDNIMHGVVVRYFFMKLKTRVQTSHIASFFHMKMTFFNAYDGYV